MTWTNEEPQPLNGSSVLLIGGTGGIGSALVAQLAKEGVASIVVASTSSANSFTDLPIVTTESVDVADRTSVESLSSRLAGRDISIVINCAGVNGNARLFEADAVEMARREIDVNYFGLMNVGIVFGERLAARGGGTLVALLSFLSHACLPSMAGYCASKAAAHSISQALRAELRDKGVRVCGIYPAAVDTRMSSNHAGSKMSAAELAADIASFLRRGGEVLLPGEAAHAYAAMLQDPDGFARDLAKTAM